MSNTSSRSPWQLFWRDLGKSPISIFCGALLILMYAGAVFANFLAPYDVETQDGDHPFHPPTGVQAGGPTGLFVYATEIGDLSSSQFQYNVLKNQKCAVRWFVDGDPYKLFGVVPSRTHLFGADAPGKVFLLGSDQYGRDLLSRLLFGARISLSIGLLGVLISFVLGMLLGGVAGYFGGWVDTATMRLTEILISIPGLYLILALRAMFPVEMPSTQVYLLVVVILAFVGWAGLARIVRGMVLSLRSQEYVLAAQALGASPLRIIARHILPNTASFIIVAATVSIPSYILGEVTLSYLGVGIQEPAASWGNMLKGAQNADFLKNYPWLLYPGLAIFLAVMAFNFLGDGLRDALDPRKVSGAKS